MRICVIGSTGSVGSAALEAMAAVGDSNCCAEILVANANVDKLFDQCQKFAPACAILKDPDAAQELSGKVCDSGLQVNVLSGQDAILETITASECEAVVACSSGADGLAYALAAVRSGKRLLLANKEALVLAGDLLMSEARESGAEVIPIDSEHSGLFRLFRGLRPPESLEKVVLTASGGPFRGISAQKFSSITPADAVRHPTWSMGRKISVDSATLMNKGLEVIEAHHLFGLQPDRIGVVIHPESVVHAIAVHVDGSMEMQASVPDMRLPIAAALAYPDHAGSIVHAPDLVSLGSLSFEEPDLDAFPCLSLAYEALRRGGAAPAVLNAANEVAVERFLIGEIGFADIPTLVEHALSSCDLSAVGWDELLFADEDARRRAMEAVPS